MRLVGEHSYSFQTIHSIITRKNEERSKIIVKLTQDLSRGFAPLKQMFHENAAKLNAHGCQLIFAGTEKDNNNKLYLASLSTRRSC